MSDLIPQGYITLTEAFERYVKEKLGKDELRTEKGDLLALGRLGEHNLVTCRQDLVSAFSDGELRAYVRPPGEAGNKGLPVAGWRKLGDYADRLFMGDVIPDHFKSGPWDQVHGRTPFVDEENFKRWSDSSAKVFQAQLLPADDTISQSQAPEIKVAPPTQLIVQKAANELYPLGWPTREQKRPGALVKEISDHMNEMARKDKTRSSAPSRDSILRAIWGAR